MVRAAGAARTGGNAKAASPRLVALQAFNVWHREQLVAVPTGEVRDPALVATLRGVDDSTLLEWQP